MAYCFCKTESVEPLKTCVCCKVSYCNKDCQSKDWRNHKAFCPPFIVREVAGKGRGLFATRKIMPGKIILEERPLLTMEGTSVSLDVFERNYIPTIDGKTKASILQLHDPADNLHYLERQYTEKDLFLLMKENPAYFKFCLSKWDLEGSIHAEACKILRIFSNNCIAICQDSDVTSNTSEAALYSQISLINHSCDPNVTWTWVRGDVKRKQVRAVKVIEKAQEILATYHSEPFGSRETRQKTLLKSHLFLCQCSQCSLEGESLLENERTRAEIRERRESIMSLMSTSPSSTHLRKRNVKKAVHLSQELMERVRKLNLQPQRADRLLQTSLPVAWAARRLELSAPHPDEIKKEALEFMSEVWRCHDEHLQHIFN